MAKALLVGFFYMIGVVLLFTGMGTFSQPNAVTCGDQTMSQGDICMESGNINVVNDYNQQQQSNQSGGGGQIIVGLCFLSFGILILFADPKRSSVESSP